MIKPTEKCCRRIDDRALAGRQVGRRSAHRGRGGQLSPIAMRDRLQKHVTDHAGVIEAGFSMPATRNISPA